MKRLFHRPSKRLEITIAIKLCELSNMLFSNFKDSIKSHLEIKTILIIVLFLCIISISLTTFFVIQLKSSRFEEIQTRTQYHADKLAFNIRYFIVDGASTALQLALMEVLRENDIVDVLITDVNGIILGQNGRTRIGQKIELPQSVNSATHEIWIPTKDNTIWRTITPVEYEGDPTFQEEISLSPGFRATYFYVGMPGPWGIAVKSRTELLMTNNSDPQGVFVARSGDSFDESDAFSTLGAPFVEPRNILIYPDGTVFLIDKSAFTLFRIGADGGSPTAFVTRESIGSTNMFNPFDIEIAPPTFSGPNVDPGDLIIADNGYGQYPAVWAVNPITGKARAIIIGRYPEENVLSCGPLELEFSPDGRLFLRSNTDYNNNISIECLDADGKVTPFLNDIPERGPMAIHPVTGDIYLGMYLSREIWRIPCDGGDIQVFARGIIDFIRNLQFTPDGHVLFVSCYPNVLEIVGQFLKPIASTKPAPVIDNTGSPLVKKGKRGYVLIDVSLENMNRALVKDILNAISITIILLGLVSLVSIRMVRRITRPIQHLADATSSVAEGNLDQAVSIERTDEIGILADSFNHMIQQLKISREEIEEWNRELEAKVDDRTAELSKRTAELAKERNELEEAYKELETLDNAKDVFLSLVSHELRTPLSSILVYSEMLLNKLVNSEETREKFHKTIVDECKRLTRLINDVLDLSKIDAGRMSFNLKSLNVRELVIEVFESFRLFLEKQGLLFDYEHVSEDSTLWGDRDRIIQVLTNIISNAVKFTPERGTISIASSNDNGMVTIAVKDTGKGMKKEDIPKVFDRFSQLENINHHSEGTGLGMTISKSIIELLGGNIWIESEPGSGTTVFFTLPEPHGEIKPENYPDKKIVTSSKSKVKPSGKSSSFKILIVDDDEVLRYALIDCVKNAGFIPIDAADGNEALRLVEQQQPDLLILDVMMPGLSGIEVCRKLKSDPRTSQIKIVILSARGQLKEKEEGLDAGADFYISKPFDYMELIKTVKQLLEK